VPSLLQQTQPTTEPGCNALENLNVDETIADCPRAGLWRRLAALLYDAFLVAAIWMLLGYLVQLAFGVDSNQVVDGQVLTNPLQDFVLFSLMVGSSFGFYSYFWMRSGQTLGMIAWRLKMVTTDNQLVSLWTALPRYLLAWPAFLLLGIGYLWMYIDANKDGLHDKLSSTKVVLVPRSHRPF